MTGMMKETQKIDTKRLSKDIIDSDDAEYSENVIYKENVEDEDTES